MRIKLHSFPRYFSCSAGFTSFAPAKEGGSSNLTLRSTATAEVLLKGPHLGAMSAVGSPTLQA